jgi:hypothetical protein
MPKESRRVRKVSANSAFFENIVEVMVKSTSVAQESRSEISLQGTGFFTKDTTGNSTTEQSTNTGGFLVS